MTLSNNHLAFKLYILFLLNALSPNFDFIACVEADISIKNLKEKYFQEKACDHIHGFIIRPSFQLIPCQELRK